MQLTMTAAEAVVLRDFLGQRLGDLSMEISHTDNPAYRRSLRDRRDTLRRIHAYLAAAVLEEPADTAEPATGTTG